MEICTIGPQESLQKCLKSKNASKSWYEKYKIDLNLDL